MPTKTKKKIGVTYRNIKSGLLTIEQAAKRASRSLKLRGEDLGWRWLRDKLQALVDQRDHNAKFKSRRSGDFHCALRLEMGETTYVTKILGLVEDDAKKDCEVLNQFIRDFYEIEKNAKKK